MPYLSISGFSPEPNPDDSIKYKKAVPQEAQIPVLTAMGWASLTDVPEGEHELTEIQAATVLESLGDPLNNELVYCIGLRR
jgi:hypothetical protein